MPNTDYIDKILSRQKRFKSMYVGLIMLCCNEFGCRVPAVPAAGEPGGGGLHAPGHHVRALLELLRWAARILSDVRLTIVLRDEIKETD